MWPGCPNSAHWDKSLALKQILNITGGGGGNETPAPSPKHQNNRTDDPCLLIEGKKLSKFVSTAVVEREVKLQPLRGMFSPLRSI